MKKIIVTACLLICVVLLCASCSTKAMDIDEFYQNVNVKFDTVSPLTTYSELSDLKDLDYQGSTGNILVFTNDAENEKTIFYNAELDKEIFKVDSKEIVHYTSFEVFYQEFLLVFKGVEKNEKTTYSVNLYDMNGAEIATKKLNAYPDNFEASNYITYSYDLFQFDGKIYRVKDNGTAAAIIDNPFFGSFPSAGLLKTSAYYYEQKNDSVVVYDHSFNQVFFWEVPYYPYESANVSVLSGEQILAQIISVLPDEEKKYDVLDDEGIKYDITSILIDVASGKEKEVDLDYIVAEVSYASNYVYSAEYTENYSVSEKIDNLASICYIKDHKISTKDTLVSLSNKDASVAFEIAPEFDSIPEKIAPNRYLYYSDSGNEYILNANFEIVAKANGLYSASTKNDYYIVKNNKIYNCDLQLVYDLAANDKTLVCLMGESFIVYETTKDGSEYYLRTSGGSMTKIENYSYSNEQYYVTSELQKEDGYTYTFYNANGTKLLSVKNVDEYSSARPIYTGEDDTNYIVCLTVKGEKIYYKFSV